MHIALYLKQMILFKTKDRNPLRNNLLLITYKDTHLFSISGSTFCTGKLNEKNEVKIIIPNCLSPHILYQVQQDNLLFPFRNWAEQKECRRAQAPPSD